jgi:hypothetical protein
VWTKCRTARSSAPPLGTNSTVNRIRAGRSRASSRSGESSLTKRVPSRRKASVTLEPRSRVTTTSARAAMISASIAAPPRSSSSTELSV